MASSTRWRILFASVHGGGSIAPACRELQMRSTPGGADECSGGTASASSTNSTLVPANAFDNNTATLWGGLGAAANQWLEYQFASAVEIKQIVYTPQSLNAAPNSFSVQYYDGSTWQTAWSETLSWVYVTHSRIFTDSTGANASAAFEWRMNVSATQAPGAYCQIVEMEMRATPGGADQTFPISGADFPIDYAYGVGNPSSNPVRNTVDDSGATRWTSGIAPPMQFGFSFPIAVAVNEISLLNHTVANDSPKTFDIQYKSNGAWVTHWSVADSGIWTASETKVFTNLGGGGGDDRRRMSFM